jgi:GNAT superfamily N-acetyltransferase
MNDRLHDISTPALIRTIEENRFEVFGLFRHWPRVEFYDDPEMLITITDIPNSVFNNVFRAQLTPENADAVIETVIARCRSRNVPLTWHVGPRTKPANLGQYLEAHGFTPPLGVEYGMAVDLLALNEDLQSPSGLTIEEVTDSATLKEFCQVNDNRFWDAWFDCFMNIGLGAKSQLRYYLGRLNGEPVSTSLVYLGESVAGIYNVATVPDARRKGIGAKVTLAPLQEARELGYRVGILQSSEMGYSVYHKVGFREYCKLRGYLWEGETEHSEDTTTAMLQ